MALNVPAQRPSGGRPVLLMFIVMVLGVLPGLIRQAHAQETFSAFLQKLWPEASAAGVKRATFDAALKDLKPDTALPDLVLPGRETAANTGQAEFSKEPRDYLNPAYLANLGSQGRALAEKHKLSLSRIETGIGVDRYSVLAIWGRETAFGQHRLPHDAITVLATQAYLGRRKELFRNELIQALKMLQDGVPRAKMRSSWAGAMGLTQFLPTEFYSHAQDFDGDGKVDLFGSVADALGSAARQLKNKGWVTGQPWGFEVVIPASADCSLEGPPGARSVEDWMKLGFARVGGRPFPKSLMSSEAYLMSPAGAHGPSFLVFENYKVIRRYNTSDLYAVFVGNLADRIAGGQDFVTRWTPIGKQRVDLVKKIQERLRSAGYEMDKIDGFIGSNTRRQIGVYQKAAGMQVDCWPSETVLLNLSKGAAAR